MAHKTLVTTPPHSLAFPFDADEPYTMLMICRDPGIIDLDKQRIAYEIGATPCMNYCVWGHDAQAWELAIDMFCVDMDIFCGIDRMIMTSQHSEESIEDAIFFATTVAPDFNETQGRVLIWFLLRSESDKEDISLMDHVLSSHYVRLLPAEQ